MNDIIPKVFYRDTYGNKFQIWKTSSGEFHRENGPAVEYINANSLSNKWHYGNGEGLWYYHGVKYSKTEEMPLNLFLNYCKWKYKKHGS